MKRKAKAVISCAVTMRLIRAFVFAYAKSRFSHDVAHYNLLGSKDSIHDLFQTSFWIKVKRFLIKGQINHHIKLLSNSADKEKKCIEIDPNLLVKI